VQEIAFPENVVGERRKTERGTKDVQTAVDVDDDCGIAQARVGQASVGEDA
jgi:hypothetical protein